MNLQSRLEKEIELIENDDSLTQQEKNKEINELERNAYDYAKEEAREKYREAMESFGYGGDY